MLKGIYAISDEQLTPYETLQNQLQEAIKGGISLFQLRDKTHSDEEILEICQRLQQQCKENNVTFILNDRVELAIKIKAQGLHIGKKDEMRPYNLEELLSIRKNFQGILGVSCYDDLNLAIQAKRIQANYVAFGACFKSLIKPEAKRVDLGIFKQCSGIARCGIGGINAQNVALLREIEMVACISSIWKGEIKENVKNLYQGWRGSKDS
ncbi:MAG: thiamine phosphate synthase [Helicobacter sp.]|nr:thiamine phosphate synthase [Helicobacter sp.]